LIDAFTEKLSNLFGRRHHEGSEKGASAIHAGLKNDLAGLGKGLRSGDQRSCSADANRVHHAHHPLTRAAECGEPSWL